MPLYEYQCDACGSRFERIQKFSDPLVAECPTCGGAVQKLVSSPAIQFKGSGWYITDYAKKTDGASKAEKSGDAKGDGKGDGKGGSSDTSKADSGTSSTKADAAPAASPSPAETKPKAAS